MTWAVNRRLEEVQENGVQDMDCAHIAKSDPVHRNAKNEHIGRKMQAGCKVTSIT